MMEKPATRWRKNPIRYHQPTKVAAPHALSLPHLQNRIAGREIRGLAFTPDGQQLLGATKEGQIYLWRVSDGYLVKLLSLIETNETSELHRFALSPDGQTMATSTEDLLVRIWRTDDGQLLYELRGHNARVKCLAISPDGQTLASAAFCARTSLGCSFAWPLLPDFTG